MHAWSNDPEQWAILFYFKRIALKCYVFLGNFKINALKCNKFFIALKVNTLKGNDPLDVTLLKALF